MTLEHLYELQITRLGTASPPGTLGVLSLFLQQVLITLITLTGLLYILLVSGTS